jgi:hypothetical protein
MIHLSEQLLNEYLDEALIPSKRHAVEAHLSTCDRCRSELKELKLVFKNLATLPEVALAHDLTPSVMGTVQQSTSWPVWRLVLAGQTGITLGLVAYLAVTLASSWEFYLRSLMNSLASLMALAQKISMPLPSFPTLKLSEWAVLRLPIQFFSNDGSIWRTLGVAAGLLFLVGNLSLVCRNRQEIQK